ncbi:MAG: hypothetical protein IKF19_03850 [Bacilli bacterium]|nr:hypothetical protein [Bacilli bacterium]
MIRQIIIKDNDKIYKKVMEIDNSPIINFVDKADKDSNRISDSITKIINDLAKSKSRIKLFKSFVEEIKNISCIDDMEKIVFDFMDTYLFYKKNRLIKTSFVKDSIIIDNFSRNKELIMDKVLSGIIYKYYDIYLSKFNRKELLDLMFLSDNELKSFFSSIGEELPFDSINDNNISRFIIVAVKETIFSSLFKHSASLCWDCPSDICLNCSKVMSDEKDDISEYSFINKGHQIYNDKVLTNFVVTGCKKYEKRLTK